MRVRYEEGVNSRSFYLHWQAIAVRQVSWTDAKRLPCLRGDGDEMGARTTATSTTTSRGDHKAIR